MMICVPPGISVKGPPPAPNSHVRLIFALEQSSIAVANGRLREAVQLTEFAFTVKFSGQVNSGPVLSTVIIF